MSFFRQLLSELLGTAGLLIVVVGSGIMGEKLADGNIAIALLANSLATGAGLYALIQTFGPTSGAHFNPAVSFSERIKKNISTKTFLAYSTAQILGGILGVLITHVMFGQNLLQLSSHDRASFGLFISEVTATFGLILVISLSGKNNPGITPFAVAAYITAAYWCTSSTSFANPAVTIARSLSDTFAGILWTNIPLYVAAQILGMTAACGVTRILRS